MSGGGLEQGLQVRKGFQLSVGWVSFTRMVLARVRVGQVKVRPALPIDSGILRGLTICGAWGLTRDVTVTRSSELTVDFCNAWVRMLHMLL